MKGQQILLWLLAILVALHTFTTMVTYPEFHVLEHTEFQKLQNKVSMLDSDSKKEVNMELIKGKWNGQYGKNLAERTLLIDCTMLLLLGALILKSRRGDKATPSA